MRKDNYFGPKARLVQEQELQKMYKTRHYYIKLAKRSLQMKNVSDCDLYLRLTEEEQRRIEEVEKYVR